MNWSPNSWRAFKVQQDFFYEDGLKNTEDTLKNKPALVDFARVDSLKKTLSFLENANGFIVQMGECAETFNQATPSDVANRLILMESFVNVISEVITEKKIIKIGRIAGQYAKPRNDLLEHQGNKSLPIYRGDMVNGIAFDAQERVHNSKRMLIAYDKAKVTLDYITNNNLFTSHEALALNYEEALTREVFLNNKKVFYCASADFLWLGERTRFLDSAHVEYLRGIHNPIGIKVSHLISSEELIAIIKKINPINEKGKVILILRMGANNIVNYLPKLLIDLKESALNVLFMCDPMHGNTIKLHNGVKIRTLEDIKFEIKNFVNILNMHKVFFAGIHLESTYQDVHECVLMKENAHEINIDKYLTYCDPRLNKEQTMLISRFICDLLKNRQG